MNKSLLTLTAFLAALSLVLFYTVAPDLRAGAPGHGFDLGSLRGSYASVGRADGSKSVSVGVAEFDGEGGVTRFVRINASGQDGKRRLIDLTSVGLYTVDTVGVGVISFTNTFTDGSTNAVTFDFVIRTTGKRRRHGSLPAETIFAMQREAGVTASLVEESFTRRSDLR